MLGCGKKCGKRRRKSKASTKGRDQSIETEYISGLDEATDLDSVLSDATESRILPEKSERNKHMKKNRSPGKKRSEYESDRSESTPQRKSSRKTGRDAKPSARKGKKFTSHGVHEEEYSPERSDLSTPRDKLSKKGSTRFFSSTEADDFSESDKSSLACATVNLSKFLGKETTESEPSDDDGAECEDEECGGGPRVIITTKDKGQSSQSESSSEETGSDGSEKCPDLCEIDPSGLPPRKPKKCDSDCRRQQWLEKQRERKQAEIDDYLLRKGFRYFDDMCKCSLKCLVSQMYVDPFVRNIAWSTVGFFLGVKLCWELDGFYIIF